MKSLRDLTSWYVVTVAFVALFRIPGTTQEFTLKTQTLVGAGWYPWYEIKADPENPQNLIVCGTKYDPVFNSFAGFVFVSDDGAASWREVLNDRNTTWVTEHSCAFGPHHLAYFISEASKVVDGAANHELGTTRLYVSNDAGQHWLETAKTGWADHSTSAVSQGSGNLYTFFNTGSSGLKSDARGTNIGLLVFSPDGKVVTGPFFDVQMKDRGHRGSYPSQARALKSGTVVALYRGYALPPKTESEFGVVRAIPSVNPVLESIVISHTPITAECPWLDHGALAYDSAHDRLYLLYGDGCKSRQPMLTFSDDEGRTWSRAVPVGDSGNIHRFINYPALYIDSRGNLTILWRDSEIHGHWYIAQIRNQQLVEPATELSSNQRKQSWNNDSLWTLIFEPGSRHAADAENGSTASFVIHVRNMEDRVWRDEALAAAADKLIAVWSLEEDTGTHLYSGVLVRGGVSPDLVSSREHKDSSISDLTGQTRLLYGGLQQFDKSTGTLKVCLVVANRSDSAIKAPLSLKATSLSSPLGAVSILNASNGLAGAGAMWDISDAASAGQILPQASSKPFCLSFHLSIRPDAADEPEDPSLLILLKMKVLASR